MDLSSAYVHFGWTYWLMLFLSVYGLWCLITIVLRRSEKPAFLALVPLFVTVPFAWLSYASIIHLLMTTVGSGRATRAAVFAEVIGLLGAGACVTAVLAVVALLRGPRQGTSSAASVVAAAVTAGLAGVTIWFASYTMHGGMPRVPNLQIPVAGGIVTAVVIVAYLVFAWRRKLYPSAIAVAAIAVLVVLVARWQFEIYWRMARVIG